MRREESQTKERTNREELLTSSPNPHTVAATAACVFFSKSLSSYYSEISTCSDSLGWVELKARVVVVVEGERARRDEGRSRRSLDEFGS